jgi:OmcA/MtrC family decaheme c-type cytochrome
MRVLLFGSLALAALACEGPAGPRGAGEPGPDGPAGEPGGPGGSGDPGDDGLSPWHSAPGLAVQLIAADIADGAATATFRITDGSGVPLDREGRLTLGPVSLAFALAWLDEQDGQVRQFTSYITREQTSPITDVTAIQATTESGGTYEVVDRADGVYRYAFVTPIALRAGRSHRVGVTAARAVDGRTVRADSVLDFRPGGGTQMVRELVSDAQCTSCHGELEGHGGRYTQTAMCTMCHTGQSTDPDSGNTLDFRVMVHRIHRGAELPSVAAGTPYQIIGFGGAHDYSTVHYPQDIERCESCHGGAQADLWKTRVSVDACTSCHDDIAFTTPVPDGKVLHGGGTQPLDQPCSTICHPASGSIAGVADVHMLPSFDPASPRLAIEILGVANSAPGQQPMIDFRVTVNGAPRDILAQPLTSLTATFAGPNTDYARFWSAAIQASTAGSLSAIEAADGRFRFQPTAPVPADAAGSFTVGLEGYIGSSPRFAALSPVRAFAVTDAAPVARRKVVDAESCNSCHYDLSFHGGGRKNPNYCVMCHNPENANDGRAPRFEDAEVFVETVDFKVMIHKIHAGTELTQPYALGGFPAPNAGNPAGSQHSFNGLRYPRRLADCSACHDGDTFGLPLADGVLPSLHEVRTCVEDPGADEDDFCAGDNWVLAEPIRIAPATAACTSCHDAPFTMAHAQVMTSPSGVESCATCHRPGSSVDVAAAHGF